MRVSICAATYLRPRGLTRLLEGLDALVFEKSPAPEIEVVVVDNDPQGSARAVCESLAPALRWPLRYVHEPRRGISQVRNRAVAETRDGSDFVAFIDDDEVPEPSWLDELLHVQARHDADMVLGPAVRLFEGEVPEWIHRGRFFEDPRYATGTSVEHGGIGNALVHTRALAGVDPPFDERLALTGGEDTLFFLRAARDGRRIIWADEAIVHEWVPPHRARARWVLQRVYRTSITWSFCERELHGSPRVALTRAVKALSRIGLGVSLLPFAWMFGRHAVVRSLWHICFGAGNLSGLAGLRYDEYRNTPRG